MGHHLPPVGTRSYLEKAMTGALGLAVILVFVWLIWRIK